MKHNSARKFSELPRKVVCVTPAGRRRYMRFLVPLVVSSKEVSRYDIWVNTKVREDLDFLQALGKSFPKVNLMEQPEGKLNGNLSINAFFREAIHEEELYIRLDDDIVWAEPGFFRKMVRSRLANQDYFLVSPLVINNAICTHLLQAENKLHFGQYLPAQCLDSTSWRDPHFAYKLHRWFLDRVRREDYDELKFGQKFISLNRFSINSISWLGETFKRFGGVVEGDEEEYLSVIKPTKMGKQNIIDGQIIISHYAFYPQRSYLDGTDLLSLYDEAFQMTYRNHPDVLEVLGEVDGIISNVENSSLTRRKSLFVGWKSIKEGVSKIKIPVIEFRSIKELRTDRGALKNGSEVR